MTEDNTEPKPSDVLQTVLVSVASAAIAGIGSLAFVIAVGGIVEEARFRGAGLPSEQSVALEGRNVLLAEGGNVLALSVLAALVIVAIVHWVDWSWPKRPRANSLLWTVILAVLVMVDYLAWDGFSIRWFPLVPIGMVVMAVAGALIVVRLAQRSRHYRLVAKDPRREAPRLAGVFAVLVFLGGLAPAAAGLTHPQVRPAAVLLSNPPQVICGIYVGETSDQLVLGEVTPTDGDVVGIHEDGFDIVVARSRIVRLLIGSSQPLKDALGKLEPSRSRPQVQYLNDLAVTPGRYPLLDCGASGGNRGRDR